MSTVDQACQTLTMLLLTMDRTQFYTQVLEPSLACLRVPSTHHACKQAQVSVSHSSGRGMSIHRRKCQLIQLRFSN